jgi:hypothetical protein
MVANWVLSPISARKNATKAVTKAPALCSFGAPSSESGCSAHRPKATKDSPTIQASIDGETTPASRLPAQAAAA